MRHCGTNRQLFRGFGRFTLGAQFFLASDKDSEYGDAASLLFAQVDWYF